MNYAKRTNQIKNYDGLELQVAAIELTGLATGPAPGEIVECDGEHYYFACDPCGFDVLCRVAECVDYGGNVYRTRRPPQSTEGINRNKSYAGVPTRVRFSEYVYGVDFSQ